jgi:hypothetical protein
LLLQVCADLADPEVRGRELRALEPDEFKEAAGAG